jgi:hypothetical protein
MSKKIVIAMCDECFYLSYEPLTKNDIISIHCQLKRKEIGDTEEIPDWCPLEDAEESNDE